MMRIVQLTTYPLKAPRHGGQLRCAAIRERYRATGFEVATIAAMREDAYRTEREAGDLVLPTQAAAWRDGLERFSDLHCGDCLVADEPAYLRFAKALDRLHPQAIQLEQPWLYPALRRWLDERAGATPPRLIYSSQNIEWKLKRDEMPPDVTDAAAYLGEIRRVEALERAVVRAADLVVACTDEELAELRAMADDGNAQRRFVVARNAIAPFSATPAQIDAVKRKHGLDRYPLFVGSAHPPNADGFWNMLAPSLAFLRPGERIVVAGGVGHILRQHRLYAAWSGINEPRLAVVGEVERTELDALLLGAAVILLPITTGGGSNLKTAEAIYSGRPALATPHALRGYGDAARWPTITVADAADAYRRTLRSMLDAPIDSVAPLQSTRDEVTWDRTLRPLADSILALGERRADNNASLPARHSAEDARARIAAIGAVIARRNGVDFEQLLERQYSKFIDAGDVVVDVGAHAGRHLACFAKLVGARGHVHGFEPLPDMHAQLRKRFASAKNVTVHNVALSDIAGPVEFVHAVGAPEESGLRERSYNRPGAVTPTRIEVTAERLDSHADALHGLRFIKIDVEGAEMNVLHGAVEVLSRYRPIVSVEYGRPAYGAYGHETFTLFDFAEQHGYAMYDIFGHRLDRAAWSVACDSVYWDYFMVPLENTGGFAARVAPLPPEALND